RTFTVTFPDDYGEAALAGKPVEFTATLLELRRQELPPLDDDFAESMGDFADLDALRTDIRTRLEQNARDRARHVFADRIIEFAVANASLVVPDLLVEREVEVMHDELKVRLAEQGIDEATYLKVTGKDEAQLHTEWREPAEHRVKVMLVLSAVADAESVTIPDADVEAEVERARLRNPANPKLVGYLGSARGRAYLRSTLRRSRVVEALVDRWLLAHPEVGPLPHLEDDSPAAPSAELTITEGSPA
ncbi:MAG: trigger factor, partial [Candidatus Limnocylindrales bacterium]